MQSMDFMYQQIGINITERSSTELVENETKTGFRLHQPENENSLHLTNNK
jgi:hypothetical protein